MSSEINVLFFDLFYTLATPKYNALRNEYDVLGITKEEWEKYAEDSELYFGRAVGMEKDPMRIIEAIIEKMGAEASAVQKDEILRLREERFKRSLSDIDSVILEVLFRIKKSGRKICLISNADIIDVMHWNESPLSRLFDDAVFSYEAGCLKPHAEIYRTALERMNIAPENSIFVGDGGSDELRGAKALGIKTVLTCCLTGGNAGQPSDTGEFTDYYIRDFREIIDIVNL
ncbi:MAG: HAD-IA family hydrolase [Bacillota bacterium]|nr:HAD-IA family hydrolase [Bacillota bacterium]